MSNPLWPFAPYPTAPVRNAAGINNLATGAKAIYGWKFSNLTAAQLWVAIFDGAATNTTAANADARMYFSVPANGENFCTPIEGGIILSVASNLNYACFTGVDPTTLTAAGANSAIVQIFAN